MDHTSTAAESQARRGPRLLDADRIARRLGVSAASVRQWRRWGLISPVAMKDRTPLYNVAEVRRAMFEAVTTGKKRVYIRHPAQAAG